MATLISWRYTLQLLILLAVVAAAAAQQGTPSTTPPPDADQAQQAPSGQRPPAGSSQPAGSQDSTSNDQQGMFVFKKQVEEVVLHATVVDQGRRLVTRLDRNAFSVFEDGHPQAITSFQREDVPVAIGVLIDNSGSMRDKRVQVNQAVLNLIRAGNPEDQVFIVNFSEKAYLDQDFTSDITLLDRALHQTSMQGSTALYDAVVVSAAHLKDHARLEKRILLVITDGKDNMSVQTLQQALEHLQQKNGPTVYAIGLMGSEGGNQARDALERLADATGGAAFFPESLAQVSEITDSLAHDIRSQYTLAYKPQNENVTAQYHPIVVEAKAPGFEGLTVRTRSGYYTGESVR